MVKTITIMNDAYELLKKLKDKEESFSDVIRKLGKREGVNLVKWFGVLKGDEKRVQEFQTAVKKIRLEASRDMEERLKKLRGNR